MVLSHRTEPQFSQPVRQIVTMLIVLGLTAAIGVLIFPTVEKIFLASPYLKIFILLVFFVGVLACFWQVLTLISSVNWIEGFALDRPGHEFTKAPRLLAPLAAMLSERRARRSLTSASTRSILESVSAADRGAARPDPLPDQPSDLPRPARHLLRPRHRGPGRVDTIRSLAPKEGQNAMASFDTLMHGLEGQLGGMGTAFGSSLLGLSGSLVVGLLELFASHAQNRFYRELEEWLSSITKLGVTGVDPEEALTAANVLMVIGQTAEQIDQLRDVVEQGVTRSAETEARIVELAADPRRAEAGAVDNGLLERIAAGQERMASLLAARAARPRRRMTGRCSSASRWARSGSSRRSARATRKRRRRRHRRRDPGAAALDRHPGAAHPRGSLVRPAGSGHRDPPGHRRASPTRCAPSRRAGGC